MCDSFAAMGEEGPVVLSEKEIKQLQQLSLKEAHAKDKYDLLKL